MLSSKKPSKEELTHLYWEEKLSQAKIGKRLSVSKTAVRKWMKQYGIPVRTKSEALRLANPATWLSGRKLTAEQKKKIGNSVKLAMNNETREKISKATKQHWKNPEYRRAVIRGHKGKKYGYWRGKTVPLELVQKRTKAIKKFLKEHQERKQFRISILEKYRSSKDRIKAAIKSVIKKPTKPEKKLKSIIEKYQLAFQYTGDGKVLIGTLNPDFIHNEKPKVIEVFGRVYHDPTKTFKEEIPWHQQYWGRIAYYSQHGYDCLVLWDDELKDEKKIIDKINVFLK